MERIYFSVASKRLVRERAQRACEYCRCLAAFSPDPFVIEHIIPLSRKGTNKASNLAFACYGCNNFKLTAVTAYDSVSRKRVRLFHPRRDNRDEHFAWADEDHSVIVGITPIGRATVNRLKLNREGAVNLRRALRQLGLRYSFQEKELATNEHE